MAHFSPPNLSVSRQRDLLSPPILFSLLRSPAVKASLPTRKLSTSKLGSTMIQHKASCPVSSEIIIINSTQNRLTPIPATHQRRLTRTHSINSISMQIGNGAPIQTLFKPAGRVPVQRPVPTRSPKPIQRQHRPCPALSLLCSSSCLAFAELVIDVNPNSSTTAWGAYRSPEAKRG